MNKILLMTGIVAAVLTGCKSPQTTHITQLPAADNSHNSLAWYGIYTGILPCANCEGLRTEIKLNEDLSFEKGTKYLGKNEDVIVTKGTFKWDKAGSAITLNGDNNEQYKVGKNILIKLDANGKSIVGAIANNYQLLKTPTDGIVEKYWKLVELNGQPIRFYGIKEAYFILKSNDHKVQGNGGCNSFFGTYELNETDKRISFSKLGSTMMACEGMDKEAQFMEVLEMADNYTTNGDVLYLNKARMMPLAKFEAVYFK